VVKPGQTIYFNFPVSGSTGAGTNADSTPTCVFYKNNAVDATVVPTVSNPATGSYNGSAVVPVGYVAGDEVEVRATAVVGGIALPPIVVWKDTVDTARVSEVHSRIGAPAGASIAADIAAVSGFVDSVETVLGTIQGYVDQVEGYTDTLETGQAGLASTLTTVQGLVDQVEGYTDSLETGQTSLATTLAAIQTTLATIQGYVDQVEGYTDSVESGQTSLAATLATIQGLVDQVEGYTDSLEGGQTSLATTLSNIQTTLSTIQGMVDQVEGYVDQVEGYTDTVESSQTSLSTAIAAVKTVADNIALYTDTLESGQATLTTALGTAQTSLNTIAGYTDTVEGTQSTLATAVAALQTAIATVQLYTDTVETVLGDIKGAGWTNESLKAIFDKAEAARSAAASGTSGVTTLLERITAVISTKAESDADTVSILAAIAAITVSLSPAQIDELAADIAAQIDAGGLTADESTKLSAVHTILTAVSTTGPVSVTPGSIPANYVHAYCDTCDALGVAQPLTTIVFQLKQQTLPAGKRFGVEKAVISDEDARLETLLLANTQYRMWAGNDKARYKDFTTGAGPLYELPSLRSGM